MGLNLAEPLRASMEDSSWERICVWFFGEPSRCYGSNTISVPIEGPGKSPWFSFSYFCCPGLIPVLFCACAFPPKATPPTPALFFPWRFPLLACKPTDGLKHSFVLCVTRIQLHCSRRLGKHLVCHFVGGRRSRFLFKTKQCQVVKYLNVSQFFL